MVTSNPGFEAILTEPEKPTIEEKFRRGAVVPSREFDSWVSAPPSVYTK
jgi:hypothetical protein